MARRAQAGHDLAVKLVSECMFLATTALDAQDISAFRGHLSDAQAYAAQYREALEWLPRHPDEVQPEAVEAEEAPAGGAA
jgi:hypothetical protein